MYLEMEAGSNWTVPGHYGGEVRVLLLPMRPVRVPPGLWVSSRSVIDLLGVRDVFCHLPVSSSLKALADNDRLSYRSKHKLRWKYFNWEMKTILACFLVTPTLPRFLFNLRWLAGHYFKRRTARAMTRTHLWKEVYGWDFERRPGLEQPYSNNESSSPQRMILNSSPQVISTPPFSLHPDVKVQKPLGNLPLTEPACPRPVEHGFHHIWSPDGLPSNSRWRMKYVCVLPFFPKSKWNGNKAVEEGVDW